MILLTVLDAVGGAIWIFFGITFLWVPYGNAGWVVAFTLGGLSIGSGYGVFTAASWGRAVGLAAGMGYVFIGFAYFAGLSLVGVPNFLFGAWTLYYLTRAGTKSYLRK